MQTLNRLHEEFGGLLAEGTRLAGSLTDVAQRAATYHHLYEDSGGNHIFPLIAAHGALWSRGYFAFGMKLGRLLTWQFPWSSSRRQAHLAELSRFADAFREINRQVCADTYAKYHFTSRFGHHADAHLFVEQNLLTALNRLHDARRAGTTLSDADKRDIFQAHFLNEQQHVVGPRIDLALQDFHWSMMKCLSLRPIVRFAYFPKYTWLWFRHFAMTAERIERGLLAFDIGAEVGWRKVEASLKEYAILPTSFFVNSADYFATVRSTVLQPCA